MSPVVIGLTVVAFGTSSPEIAAGVSASLQGAPDVALGNVVGSNVFNSTLLLGLAALVAPLGVARRLQRIDLPLLLGLSLLTPILSLDGRLGAIDGAVFTAGLPVYAWLTLRSSRPTKAAGGAETADAAGRRRPGLAAGAAISAGGLALLVLGAECLVDAAVSMARSFGVSELVVGLTVVAVGTSLPEVAASVVAAARGRRDIAVGNAVGSSLFNLMGVLGPSALLASDGLPVSVEFRTVEMGVMVAAAAILLPFALGDRRIGRVEGAYLVAAYAAFLTERVLEASGSAMLATWRGVLLYGGVPITVAILVVAVLDYRRARRPRKEKT
jgi:cation:H+ antiporter